jgi:hypothetical protein
MAVKSEGGDHQSLMARLVAWVAFATPSRQPEIDVDTGREDCFDDDDYDYDHDYDGAGQVVAWQSPSLLSQT